MAHVFGGVCDALGLRYWVSHGTLLGALRDGGLSLHADDIEVDVPEADVGALQGPAMRAALARNGYELSYDPRGRCLKVWPSGSPRAAGRDDDQTRDQSWWLPQRRLGSPTMDIYIVQSPEAGGGPKRYYVSNEEFHCNERVCTQVWGAEEMLPLLEVPFGEGLVRAPAGAAAYLSRVYGDDWNTTVRPHGWMDRQGRGFDALDVRSLKQRAAGPTGPLPLVLLPSKSP